MTVAAAFASWALQLAIVSCGDMILPCIGAKASREVVGSFPLFPFVFFAFLASPRSILRVPTGIANAQAQRASRRTTAASSGRRSVGVTTFCACSLPALGRRSADFGRNCGGAFNLATDRRSSPRMMPPGRVVFVGERCRVLISSLPARDGASTVDWCSARTTQRRPSTNRVERARQHRPAATNVRAAPALPRRARGRGVA